MTDNAGGRFYISCIGILMCLFSFSGYEGAAHMSEETTNATLSAPKGIFWTCVATGITGFVYLLGLLYACQGQVADSEGEPLTATGVFTLAFTDTEGNHNVGGTLAMTILLVINLFFAGFSSFTVTTRIGFAMARDGAIPCSGFWYKVTEKNKIPYMMIVMVFLADCLLCLLPLINPLAFTAVTSITVIGYQVSYAIPILLRVTCARKKFKQSAFSLGRFSVIISWVAGIWLIVTSTFFIWPTAFDENMEQNETLFNYTCVVFGGVFIIVFIYWFLPKPLGARHFFVGPKRDDVPAKGI